MKCRKKDSICWSTRIVPKKSPKPVVPPPPPPKNIEEARGRKDLLMWAKSLGKELERHGQEQLHTFDFVDPLSSDRPILYTLTLKVKINQFAGPEEHKISLSIRGDRMRPEIDFDEARTQSHTPS